MLSFVQRIAYAEVRLFGLALKRWTTFQSAIHGHMVLPLRSTGVVYEAVAVIPLIDAQFMYRRLDKVMERDG